MPKRFYLALALLIGAMILMGFFVYFSQDTSSLSSRISGQTLERLKPMPGRSVTSTPPEGVVTTTVPEVNLTLLFAGDIMLDRSVMLKTQAAGDWNHPFLLIDPLFQKYDLRIANLEGPITNFPSIANGVGGARFTFTFSPNFVEPLQQRFEYLSLANNHTHNFGEKGLIQAREFLTQAGIKYFGDPDNRAGFLSVTSTHQGTTVGFVGYHQLVEQGFDRVVAEVQTLDPLVDLVVVLPHWGEEYVTDTPTIRQTSEARALVDAGADLIIGAHPHVVQPIEKYQDRVIFYSLGNFIFDQYFSEETMTGLVVGLSVQKKTEGLNLAYELIPIDISGNSQPSVADANKTQKLKEHLARVSLLSESEKESILQGTLFSSYEF